MSLCFSIDQRICELLKLFSIVLRKISSLDGNADLVGGNLHHHLHRPTLSRVFAQLIHELVNANDKGKTTPLSQDLVGFLSKLISVQQSCLTWQSCLGLANVING